MRGVAVAVRIGDRVERVGLQVAGGERIVVPEAVVVQAGLLVEVLSRQAQRLERARGRVVSERIGGRAPDDLAALVGAQTRRADVIRVVEDRTLGPATPIESRDRNVGTEQTQTPPP